MFNLVVDTEWKEFKLNYIDLELMMFVRFHYLVLVIKDILDNGINSLASFHKDVRSQ